MAKACANDNVKHVILSTLEETKIIMKDRCPLIEG